MIETTNYKMTASIITHNNPTMFTEEYLLKWYEQPEVSYVAGQLEKGTEGTPHIQCYVHLKKNQRLSWWRKRDKKAHFEMVKINNGAHDYCMKEESRIEGPFEYGTRPLNRAKKADWEKVYALAKEGKLEEIPADIRVRSYCTLKRIEKDHVNVSGEHTDCKGIWVYGPPGVGKSREARAKYPDAYKKLANKWWDGYQGQEAVLFEDIDPSHTYLGYHLKLWADRYHCPGETKGG